MSNLKNEVLEILESYVDDDERSLKEVIEDVNQYGCQSGYIREMIWFSDTTKFFNTHREEIAELIETINDEIGTNILTELKDFIQEDPLCFEPHNKNLLAWFAFEEVTREIGIERGLDL